MEKMQEIWQKKRKRLGLWIPLGLFLVLSILVLGLFCADYGTVNATSGEKYRSMDEYLFPDYLKTPDDGITQYFVPQHSNLKDIQIRLAFASPELLEEFGATIALTIRDAQGNELQRVEVPDEDAPNWGYYVLSMDMSLKKGQTYSLTLQQLQAYCEESTGEFRLSYEPFIYSDGNAGEIPAENLRCEWNGVEQDYQMDLYYEYTCRNDNLFHLTLLILVLLAVLVLAGLFSETRGAKITAALLVVLSPLLWFILTELITGNLDTIEHSYWKINLAIYYSVLLLGYFLIRNSKIVLALGYAFFPLLALVQYYVNSFRGRPFLIIDIASLKTAASVMGSYDFSIGTASCLIALVCSAGLLCGSILLPNICGKRFCAFGRVLSAVCIVAVCAGLCSRSVMAHFSCFSINNWDPSVPYTHRGYLCALLPQLQYIHTEIPDGYSSEAVEDIAQSEETPSPVTNTKAQNLILIMNESWSDFRVIGEFDQQDTIMPNIDALTENVIQGHLYMSGFGACTANSEYQALTGNCMQLFDTPSLVPYHFYIHDHETGLVSTLKSQGFSSQALHPNNATNYNRNIVYSQMGFDEFLSITEWPGKWNKPLRGVVTDSAAYGLLIEEYEQQEAGKPFFSFMVTMQNHGGYTNAEFESTVDLNLDQEYPQAEQYLSIQKYSDTAFMELIEYFENVDEPTMVVMFGDHMPSIEQGFYEELYGAPLSELSFEELQQRYCTPMVIWANYDIDEAAGVEMSANYLGSYLLEQAGLEMTDYNRFLLAAMEEIPVINNQAVRDAAGEWYSFAELPDHLAELLQKYRILQYNNVFGANEKVADAFSLSDGGN
ncbi:LTA synthase family protein [Oscillibacter sp.]|uniref:LTA synthase family protein n=1 Tax=Oscillibacter sp. TaxID=1945593 RepID=UPI00262FAF53|nr:LTA synthase family protein [Oscillibacter sp.]MDD3346470.1 LTA synthase family protein [Oscillibacter sp.]